MTNSSSIRNALARHALEYVPPLLRSEVLNDTAFCKEFSIKADGIISFGGATWSVRHSILFDAVRSALAGSLEVPVKDTQGKIWMLRVGEGKKHQRPLILSSGDEQYELPDFTTLSPEADDRLAALEEYVRDVNLPVEVETAWHAILTERALWDEEVQRLQKDIRDTPVYMLRSIKEELGTGQCDLSTMVPRSRVYYERLVGAYDGSSTIQEYAEGPGRELVTQLLEWDKARGLRLSLFLASHSSLMEVLDVSDIKDELIINTFKDLSQSGDWYSVLGAVEIGLKHVQAKPQLEPELIDLIQKILTDDPEQENSSFTTLSALFVLVDGELSRLCLFANEPPFYRRLAALAQASLVQHAIALARVKSDDLNRWAIKTKGEQFYLQSLVDMQQEPRWYPDYATAEQMKLDFCGRIFLASKVCSDQIPEGGLRELALGEGGGAVRSFARFPHAYFPGPLEGGMRSPVEVPTELEEAILSQLAEECVTPESFIALANSVLSFHIEPGMAELATSALKREKHHLSKVQNREHLIGVILGLAKVAAATRSSELAGELRIVVRRYRIDPQFQINIREALYIGLVASASHREKSSWGQFLGDWITELAFGDLGSDEISTFLSHLTCLLEIAPTCWVYCSRADAALRALNGS